ncbi:unnamed protein product [marine sediment metagenome]|uniref:Uncharacterized protein n=1 Tax=marine sediment metagenome TaxID=412755 RepID=X0UN64_9ZZZZ
MRPNNEASIQVTCRICGTDQLDFLHDLRPAYKAGWRDIIKVPWPKYPIPERWWTHVGVCPGCQKLSQETIEPLCKPSGLMRLFRTAS